EEEEEVLEASLSPRPRAPEALALTPGSPFLGVRYAAQPPYHLGGVEVHEVIGGSAAARAGVRAGDVITRLGERRVRDAADLVGAILEAGVGRPVRLGFVRGDEVLEVDLALEPRGER
ncbi:MAG: PDZ domain-containing protein, partial [Planctomycetes bacterium]|nr:PDZ domain-containing protein [Planctomycetota bacterium]